MGGRRPVRAPLRARRGAIGARSWPFAGPLYGPLKLIPRLSDLLDMALVELSCPICDADFALGGDEKPGDEIYCSFCGSPCRLTGDPYDQACEIEEEI